MPITPYGRFPSKRPIKITACDHPAERVETPIENGIKQYYGFLETRISDGAEFQSAHEAGKIIAILSWRKEIYLKTDADGYLVVAVPERLGEMAITMDGEMVECDEFFTTFAGFDGEHIQEPFRVHISKKPFFGPARLAAW